MSLGLPGVLGLTGAALVAGTVDAIAGGGGLVTVTALLFCGLPPHVVLGTNKGQSVFGSFSAMVAFGRAGALDRRRALATFPGGFAGALAGAALQSLVSPAALKPTVLALLVLVALFLVGSPHPKRRTPPSSLAVRRALEVSVALALGTYDGFFGPGTGTFLILAFATLLADPLPSASADAKVVNFASNLGSVLVFASQGTVDWAIALPMAAGQAAGGLLGARLVLRGGARLVRLGMIVVVLALVGKLGWELLRARA